jgi:hypothetical protein
MLIINLIGLLTPLRATNNEDLVRLGHVMTSWGQNQNRSSFRRGVETGLNALIMLACLALVVGVVYINLRPSRSPQSSLAVLPKRAKLKISGVEWSDSQRTIVLALSTHCHFCTASGDFYKRLQGVARARGVPIVAVLPQPTDEARSYLQNLGVPITVVKQAPLDSLSVSATPTLMVVNSEGVVTDSWIGQLSPKIEKEVISKL